jgi:hypothetical protein
MLIAIAGPCSSDSKAQKEENFCALNRAAPQVFLKDHIPVIGMNLAPPVMEYLGGQIDRYEAVMEISLAVIEK